MLADSKLSVILKKCGWSRKSATNLRQISEALHEAGIHTVPSLTMSVRPDERVYFLSHPPTEMEQWGWNFPTEREFENFIYDSWTALPLPLGGIKIIGRQVAIKRNRVDILGYRPRAKEIVVIELKNKAPDDRTVGQLGRYMRDVAECAGEGLPISADTDGVRWLPSSLTGYSTRGLLITGAGDPSVRTALAVLEQQGLAVDWWRYDLRVNFAPVSLTDD
jgi:hypothetical protein